MSDTKAFSSDDLFDYLKILAKKFRKLNGKNTPAELYLVGGASILLNYNFREMTYDIDAIIRASSAMKDAIRQVSDEKDLPNDWLNTDFKNTTSYTPQIMRFADYRCELCNVLRIYTVSAEYLIAMKLMAGREYKHDLSDVVGIIFEHNIKSSNNKSVITLESVKKAVINLYGDWNKVPKKSQDFIEVVFKENDLESFKKRQEAKEKEAFLLLKQFERDYPDKLNNSNVQSVIENLRKIKTSNNNNSNSYFIEIEAQEQVEKLKQADIPYDLKKCRDGKLIVRIDEKDSPKAKELLAKKDSKIQKP